MKSSWWRLASLARTFTLLTLGSAHASPLIAQKTTTWWPASGAVILGGGGLQKEAGDAILDRLIALAGDPDAVIVVIPTATDGLPAQLATSGVEEPRIAALRRRIESRGARHVMFLHTRDRGVANSEEFAKILRSANGVFIPGGAARVVDNTYRGTLVARELRAVLARGGVLAGDSAGAIALGCYMLGWTPDPWGIVVEGIAALPNVAVVPHASAAKGYVPWEETLKYLVAHPGPIGAVIDENTVLVLKGSTAEVIGTGRVSLVNPAMDSAKPYLALGPGTITDLSKQR
jgi:cyanophycinase